MAEYISKERVIEWFRPYGHTDDGIPFSTLKTDVMGIPAADVAPVVHGRWVDGKCSNCGVDIPTDDAHDVIFESDCHFCYYCGAMMDGGADCAVN